MSFRRFKVPSWSCQAAESGQIISYSSSIHGHSYHNVSCESVRYSQDVCKQIWLDQALKSAEIMQQQGIPVPRNLAYQLLHECPNVDVGKRVRPLMTHSGLISIAALSDQLIRAFASCGNVIDANEAFSKVEIPVHYTWNAILSAQTKLGKGKTALELYGRMQYEGAMPDKFTLSNLIKACGRVDCIEQGRSIHAHAIDSELDSDIFVGSSLIDMYAKCGSLDEAHMVFYSLPDRNVVTWGAIIAGYVQHGEISLALECFENMPRNGLAPDLPTWTAIIAGCAQGGENILALECFESMQKEGIKPNNVTFLSIVNSCASSGMLQQGRYIHQQIIEKGIQFDAFIANTLLDMYAKCGSLKEASEILGRIANPDVVTVSAMIAGYVQHGEVILALDCFESMQQRDINPSKVTYLSILKACGNICAITQGRQFHQQIIEAGLQHDIVVGNTLLDMYAKSGHFQEAHTVFNSLDRDVITWAAMIAGYAEHGKGLLALEHFETMQQEGIQPTKAVYLSIIKACANIEAIEKGRHIQKQIFELQLQSDAVVGSALIDMYMKCGSLKEARAIFDELPKGDITIWSAMIAGYMEHGEGLLAVCCFEDMQQMTIKPNVVTFLNVLRACGSIGAVEQGRHIHKQIIDNGLQFDVVVGSALVDMYAKCGNIEEASKVFENLPSRDIVTWNSMIAGCAQSGDVRKARQCLEYMQEEGIEPNAVTFATLLAACSQSGLVDEGCKLFMSMAEDHGISPDVYHYTCLIDLLSRTGHLNEAEHLLNIIPPDLIGWTSLLAACRAYGNVEIARRCFTQVVQLDPLHAGGYVLMSGVYSDACLGKDALKIEELRQSSYAWKKPAKAWIEVNKKVHEFIVGDRSHPQKEQIFTVLKTLTDRMKEAGYMPRLDLVLQQLPNKDKEDALCGHSEKLAIAFGLLSTPSGTTIRVTKNLRVCMDCHNATKIISKIEKREIIIKDAFRIHHFTDASCSCGDFT